MGQPPDSDLPESVFFEALAGKRGSEAGGSALPARFLRRGAHHNSSRHAKDPITRLSNRRLPPMIWVKSASELPEAMARGEKSNPARLPKPVKERVTLTPVDQGVSSNRCRTTKSSIPSEKMWSWMKESSSLGVFSDINSSASRSSSLPRTHSRAFSRVNPPALLEY